MIKNVLNTKKTIDGVAMSSSVILKTSLCSVGNHTIASKLVFKMTEEDMAIQSFSFGTREKNKEDSSVVRASLSFKDQTSANAVKRKTRDLSHKIGTSLQPIFINRKVEQDLKPRKIKPPIINPQCVVYSFTRDL